MRRLQRALREFKLEGVGSNVFFLRAIAARTAFRSWHVPSGVSDSHEQEQGHGHGHGPARIHTMFLAEHLETLLAAAQTQAQADAQAQAQAGESTGSLEHTSPHPTRFDSNPASCGWGCGWMW